MPNTRNPRLSRQTRRGQGSEDSSVPSEKAAKVKQPYPSSRPSRDAQRSKTSIAALVWPSEEHAPMMFAPAPKPASPGLPGVGPVMRQDSGLLTRGEFLALEEQYLASLDVRKKQKALISQQMFDNIWLVLHYPKDSTILTPQFRWWVRKMFSLAHPDELEDAEARGQYAKYCGQEEMAGQTFDEEMKVVVHEGKRVAIREQIYDIICACHERVKHAGRDRTSAEIRKTYRWVPKDLIALFVKNCPTCVRGRPRPGVEEQSPHPEANSEQNDVPTMDYPRDLPHPRTTPIVPQLVPFAANGLMLDPWSGYSVPSGGFVPWAPYTMPPLGHQLDAHSHLVGHSQLDDRQGAGTGWCFPPADALTGGGYLYAPASAPGPAAFPPPQAHDLIRLPSINVPAGADGSMAYQPAKVTLPPLSQVLSGGLTRAAGCGPARVRQPLQVLPHNVATRAHFVPLQMPVGAHPSALQDEGRQPSYVPQIDPALLADGVCVMNSK